MRAKREDLRVPDAEADIYLVGLGIGGFEQRTVATDGILRQSEKILHLTAFDSDLRQNFGDAVIDLSPLYQRFSDPAQTYAAMADEVYAAWEASVGPVAYLTYGHPLFLVDSSWILRERCSLSGVRLKSLPATSFLDGLFGAIDSRLDHGFLYLEAQRFMALDDEAIPPTAPLVIAQAGDYGSDRLRPTTHRGQRALPLLSKVERVFAPDSIASVFLLSWRSDMAPQFTTASVANVHSLTSSVHVGCSIAVVPK